MRNIRASQSNGYSIAEILLVFGIIAGVLIGVWAMYTMLSDESEIKTTIAEVEIIKDALHEYRNAGGNYATLRRLDPTSDNTYGQFGQIGLGPYLPINFGSDARNILGGQINFRNLGNNMMMTYSGFSSYEKCRRVLEHFGEIIEDDHHGSSIVDGTTIYGFTTATGAPPGCTRAPYTDRSYPLTIIII